MSAVLIGHLSEDGPLTATCSQRLHLNERLILGSCEMPLSVCLWVLTAADLPTALPMPVAPVESSCTEKRNVCFGWNADIPARGTSLLTWCNIPN